MKESSKVEGNVAYSIDEIQRIRRETEFGGGEGDKLVSIG